MSNFYTSIETAGNHILFRGIVNGKRVKPRRIKYEPCLYTKTDETDTGFKTIHGEFLRQTPYKSIYSAKEHIKNFGDAIKLYGMQSFTYQYITEEYGSKLIEYDISKILIAYIDIEVGSENGFPKPETASEPITAITILINGRYFAFGCGDFKVPDGRPDIKYIKCTDELDLIDAFLALWTKFTPDIISGWSIEAFDVPYLVNRITKLCGAEKASQLSPWGLIRDKKVFIRNQERIVYDLVGIETLDYFDLYGKYAPHPNQESQKLGFIASTEIGEGKINYEEYANLHTLYKRNFQLFMEYNIQDVTLVYKINQKMRLIELAITMGYDNYVNYSDVFSQVRMWDSIINNHLFQQGIVIPPKRNILKKQQFTGAYVKEPTPGMYGWGVNFDLDGLYPHLIMMYNLSPETLIEIKDLPPEVQQWRIANLANISVEGLLNGKLDTSILKQYQMTMTPNGAFFTTKFQGFLPKLMESYYEDRKRYKKEMLKYEKLLATETDPVKIAEYKNLRAMNSNFQAAKKITLNSAYGAIGNEYFRFFDVRIAEAVTLSGQLSARWIGKKVNEWMNDKMGTKDVDYIIASDTDSIYIRFDGLVKPGEDRNTTQAFIDKLCEDELSPYIDKQFVTLTAYVNAYAHKMKMKRENIFNRGIWTGKKRYFLNIVNGEGGLLYKEPKIKVTGNDAVRSSTPGVVRGKLREAFKIIMNKDQNDLRAFCREFKKEWMQLPAREVASPRGCNDLTGWLNTDPVGELWQKSCPMHVKGAIVYNNAIKTKGIDKNYHAIMDGEKIKFMPLIEPNPVGVGVISFPEILPDELDLVSYLDYNTQYETVFIKPLQIVMDAIGWSLEEQSTLASFWQPRLMTEEERDKALTDYYKSGN